MNRTKKTAKMKSYLIEPNHIAQAVEIQVCELHGSSGQEMMSAIRYALQCKQVEVFYGRGSLEGHAIYLDQDALLNQDPELGFMSVPDIMDLPFAGRAVILGVEQVNGDDVMVEPHIEEEELLDLLGVSYCTRRYAEMAFDLAESREQKAREFLNDKGDGPMKASELPTVFNDDSIPVLRWVRLDAQGVVPRYESERSSCFSVFAKEDVLLPARSVVRVGLGLAVDIPAGHVIRLFGRPSQEGASPRLCNGSDLVTHEHQGELSVVLGNDRDEDVLIKRHVCLAYGLVQEVKRYLMLEVDELPTPIDL